MKFMNRNKSKTKFQGKEKPHCCSRYYVTGKGKIHFTAVNAEWFHMLTKMYTKKKSKITSQSTHILLRLHTHSQQTHMWCRTEEIRVLLRLCNSRGEQAERRNSCYSGCCERTETRNDEHDWKNHTSDHTAGNSTSGKSEGCGGKTLFLFEMC